MITELLAPAKDKEIAFAAIDYGADAVYIGASAYGARQNAANTLDDIKEVVEYAHRFWVKVFVTVNTILKDSELDNAVKLVSNLDKIGVDAIIVQDFGLVNRLRQTGIKLPIHASTQCNNQSEKKVEWLKNIGFSRVVLARELSCEKIKEIHKKNPDIELEAFIHGALCVSYSGQCYLSQYIGGRSANRGECAQPCRKKYSVINDKNQTIAKDIHALCLKDLNLSNSIKDMIDAGIYSFKVEGRLKDINYVKNVISFYRQKLDEHSKKSSSGVSFIKFKPNLEKSFNRGFTEYFFKNRENCFNFNSPKSQGEYIGTVIKSEKNYLIIKAEKTLNVQDGLFCCNDGFLINRIDGNKIYPNKNINIKPGTKIYRNLDTAFEKELSLPVKRRIGVDVLISKKIKITDEDGINIELEITTAEKSNNPEKMKNTFIQQFLKTGESDFYVKNIKIESEIPFLPISEINKLRRTSLELLMKKRIASYKQNRAKEIKYSNYIEKEVDYRANIFNKEAQLFYKNCGVEVTENAMESTVPSRQIELMRTKHCIKYALNMCKSAQNLFLVDEKGVKYPLKFDCKKCEMCILSPIKN